MNERFKNFQNKIKQAISENPSLKDEIMDIYDLCMSESEDPSTSLIHEIELAEESLRQLLEENKEVEQGVTEWETPYEREL
jgi:ACT domain-containing protein